MNGPTKCEVCGGKGGAFHMALKVVICEPCLEVESRANAAFNRRCDEDDAFVDRAAGLL